MTHLFFINSIQRKFLLIFTALAAVFFFSVTEIFAAGCLTYTSGDSGVVTESATTCPNKSTLSQTACTTSLICTLASGGNCCSDYEDNQQSETQSAAYQACLAALASSPTPTEIPEVCTKYEALGSGDGAKSADPCVNLPNVASQNACRNCMYGSVLPSTADFAAKPVGFWTGLGCLSTNPFGAVAQLTFFMLGVSGVFILFQILIGAFTMLTSKGNPQGVQDAKKRITNSVIALLFIIFSVTILQFIGVGILKLPGFFSN